VSVRTGARRRPPWLALKLVVSAGLLGWLLSRTGLGSIGSVLRGADVRLLGLALTLGVASTCVQATQWNALLRATGLQRSWLRCLRLVFVGNLFNSVLPSSIGGDAARAVLAAEHPAERIRAASTVVLQRLCNFPGMILMMALGVVVTLGDADAAKARAVAIIGVVLGTAALAATMTPMLGWLSRRPLLQRFHASRALAELLAILDAFRQRRGVLFAASVRGCAFWGLSVLNQWAFMHAVGVDISLAYAVVVVTVVNGLTMLPISINGYGVREGGFVALLTVGTLATKAQALAVGFCLAAQSLVFAAVGAVCFLSLSRRRRPNGLTTTLTEGVA
jgi:uncharacterized protein (TIRG00374 family)